MPDTPSPAPDSPFEIFLTALPGLEPFLCDEVHGLGFPQAVPTPGGVTLSGGWADVWHLNLWTRGATRVLARIASFRAPHLAQLDKRARRVDWPAFLHPNVPVRVEASCTRSRIYHARAAAQRIERALADTLGIAHAPDAHLRLLARIEDDLCTLSIDTSGAPLHQRGTKQAVGKAPLRETMAALLLRAAQYDSATPLIDPMCGSGTFPLEAAGIAAGFAPGLHRSFAFEALPSFDASIWADQRKNAAAQALAQSHPQAWGFDRDQGAIANATANAERASLADRTCFACQPVSALRAPPGPPGLILTNPPYGARIGSKHALRALYASFGDTLKTHFKGWRVGFITSDPALARATALPLGPPGPPLPHGGLKVRLYQTAPLR